MGERDGKKIWPLLAGAARGWRGRIGKTVDASGTRVDETGPLPDLACAEGRKCTILFDSNTATNPKVEAARFAFRTALRKRKAKSVATPNLPTHGNPDCNGPDDFLSLFGGPGIFRNAGREARAQKNRGERGRGSNAGRIGMVVAEPHPQRETDDFQRQSQGDAGGNYPMLDFVHRYTTGRDWPDQQKNTD